MCGIAGIWRFSDSLEVQELQSFTRALAHRGPDSEGFFLDETVSLGLGHRRLSILDVSDRGHQPMCYRNRYWISYNGEVFNFIELRSELRSLGHRFVSNTDTEVVLAAYAQWGTDCLFKFNGMWAFAIWDAHLKRLFLARDRFGIKPLYYISKEGTSFLFASETPAFRELRDYAVRIDSDSMATVVENVFSLEGEGRTIYEGIQQVRPGHCVTVCSGGVQQRRWWDTLDHIPGVPESYEKQVESFHELFRASCRDRLRSDVPVGTALSGGIDSSAVYCMINAIGESGETPQRMPADWQRAYTGIMPGTSLDESAYARQVLDFTGGTGVDVNVGADATGDRVIDETLKYDYVSLTPPIGGSIYQRMSQDVKVSLDGHGVDEMLFGYNDLVLAVLKDALRYAERRRRGDLRRTYLRMWPETDRASARDSVDELFKRHQPGITTTLYAEPMPLFVKKLWRSFNKKAARSTESDTTRNGAPAIWRDGDWLLYRAFHENMLPTILRNFDRLSMASGIEIRMPFMDWRLVSFVFGLQQSSKVGKGYSKRILRDAMKGLMPEIVRKRTWKVGLNAPAVEWFNGPLKTFLLELSHSSSFRQSTLWDGKALAAEIGRKAAECSWQWTDCIRIWPCLSAHILMER